MRHRATAPNAQDVSYIDDFIERDRWERSLNALRSIKVLHRHVGVSMIGLLTVTKGALDGKTIEEIADAAGVSARSVMRSIPILEDAGWLIVERGTGSQITKYRFRFPEADHGDQRGTKRHGDRRGTKACHSDQQGTELGDSVVTTKETVETDNSKSQCLTKTQYHTESEQS